MSRALLSVTVHRDLWCFSTTFGLASIVDVKRKEVMERIPVPLSVCPWNKIAVLCSRGQPQEQEMCIFDFDALLA